MTQETLRRIAAARKAGATLRAPDFARGVRRRPVSPTAYHVGRFSEGIEALPEDSPSKRHLGRFSDGIETLPEDSPSKVHVGRFSDGIEHDHAA
jgi:hypothetical protein